MNKELDMIGDYIRQIEEELYLIERTADLKQQKIDKAIEYIKSRARKAGVQLMPREKELLEILGDKE